MAEMFLQLDGITGESLDEQHHGEIEITDWVWTADNKASYALHQADATSHGTFKEITVTKIVDNATVALMKHLALGNGIPRGQITCRKNDGDTKLEYLTIELEEIMIKTIDFKAPATTEFVVPEAVTLGFGKFIIEYTMQRNSGESGGVRGSNRFGWNNLTQQPID